jgi:hypothetical protein
MTAQHFSPCRACPTGSSDTRQPAILLCTCAALSVTKHVCFAAVAAAALFELTSRQVPSKETKTLLGAGLAVLGVNLVSTEHQMYHVTCNTLSWSLCAFLVV